MTEKYFTPSDCTELPVHDGPGLFIAGVESTRWSSIEACPAEEVAMNLRYGDDLFAIVTVNNRPSNVMDGLAVSFARHLRGTRYRRNGAIDPACVTSAVPPLPPRECVRIPHLVTTAFSPELDDTVIWELKTVNEAEEWLGAPLNGQEFVERSLERIINLRKEIRNRKLATTDQEKELHYHLSKGKYLSALFVYQHLNLFENLFKEIDLQ